MWSDFNNLNHLNPAYLNYLNYFCKLNRIIELESQQVRRRIYEINLLQCNLRFEAISDYFKRAMLSETVCNSVAFVSTWPWNAPRPARIAIGVRIASLQDVGPVGTAETFKPLVLP